MNKFQSKFNQVPASELLVYGRVENMIIKGNILSLEENNYGYRIIDFKNRRFPVYFDGINTHILNFENKNITDKELLSKVTHYRFDFFDEDATEIKKIVNPYL